jgi:hypothetical protein
MSWSELSWVLLGAGLLFCIGMLLGATWTIQAMRSTLSQQADERRQLNYEWQALHAARCELDSCPRCGYLMAEQIRNQIEPDYPAED